MEFLDEANRLLATEAVRQGLEVSTSISFHHKNGVSHDSELPHDDQLAVLFHRLRPFVLQKERTHFQAICRILDRRISHEGLRRVVAHHRKLFLGQQFEEQMKISSDDMVINRHTSFMKWLNAFEYHRDLEKQNEFSSVHQVIPPEHTKALFVVMAIDMIKAIGALATWIESMKTANGATVVMKANAAD